MRLKGIAPGTRLVTMSGDIAELIEVSADGDTARVRYVEVETSSPATVGGETTISVDDIITADGARFIGPPRTASTSAS
jgi:hypothetical protein